jgi:septum formation protein
VPDPSPPAFVLASASPRRVELLGRVGLEPEVVPAAVDEAVLPGEPAVDYVVRVAADKAHAVAARRPGCAVLGADTAVVLDGEPLGKPVDDRHALELLERLAGRTHDVLSAVVVVGPDGIEHTAVARARVTFADVGRDELEWYVATGEPADKAGGYALQGAGALLVERLEGDPTTVIGLPLRTAVELLRLAGVDAPPSGPRPRPT